MKSYEELGLRKTNKKAPYNAFWAFGPNVSHYPGAFPNGFLPRLMDTPWWGTRRLHLCSGTVQDGTTIDINPGLKPSIVADLNYGIPVADNSFDLILIDPPYSEEKAKNLYALPLLSVPRLLKEAGRVVTTDGFVILLDLRVWPPPKSLKWEALIAIYIANRGPKPLRSLSVLKNVTETR
jgi:SAM-dependent methyltransferase